MQTKYEPVRSPSCSLISVVLLSSLSSAELEPSTSCPQATAWEPLTLQPTLPLSPSSLSTLSSAGAEGETLSLLRSSPEHMEMERMGLLRQLSPGNQFPG